MPQKILRLSDIKSITGLSRSSIYLRISEGQFPQSINIGGRAVGWKKKLRLGLKRKLSKVVVQICVGKLNGELCCAI